LRKLAESSRNNVQRMVRLKYDQKGPPVYRYYFTWQHTGGADTGREDGDGLGEFRPHGQSQPTRVNVDRHGSNTLSNDGVRQSLPMVDDPEGELRRILLS
jgi:hypothetical protein